MRFADARILIFAKAPEPGQVKTRLIPVLGARGAADLQARLLRDTMARLAATRLASIELWCAPDCLREPFPELADRYRLGIHGQRGTELGERMLHAATDALRRGDKVVLVGTDCPSLDGAYLEQALMALEGHDAVLGPVEDGGYGLLGLKRAAETLFRDMPWGSDRVAELTRNRMEGLAWQWAELPLLWDLDRPEDLERLDRFF